MSADSVRVKCPNLCCQTVLAVPITARGKTVRCKNCGTNLRIPPAQSAAPPSQKPSAA